MSTCYDLLAPSFERKYLHTFAKAESCIFYSLFHQNDDRTRYWTVQRNLSYLSWYVNVWRWDNYVSRVKNFLLISFEWSILCVCQTKIGFIDTLSQHFWFRSKLQEKQKIIHRMLQFTFRLIYCTDWSILKWSIYFQIFDLIQWFRFNNMARHISYSIFFLFFFFSSNVGRHECVETAKMKRKHH